MGDAVIMAIGKYAGVPGRQRTVGKLTVIQTVDLHRHAIHRRHNIKDRFPFLIKQNGGFLANLFRRIISSSMSGLALAGFLVRPFFTDIGLC